MAKPRLYEVASDLGTDSKTLMGILREMGEFVKSPSSALSHLLCASSQKLLPRSIPIKLKKRKSIHLLHL